MLPWSWPWIGHILHGWRFPSYKWTHLCNTLDPRLTYQGILRVHRRPERQEYTSCCCTGTDHGHTVVGWSRRSVFLLRREQRSWKANRLFMKFEKKDNNFYRHKAIQNKDIPHSPFSFWLILDIYFTVIFQLILGSCYSLFKVTFSNLIFFF